METLLFVTGNPKKFEDANYLMKSFEIHLEQVALDISEIQSDSAEEITHDKAKKAFEILKKPLFVNDSSWLIPALNGFPGPYMKYINQWFTSQDFINLMAGHDNREIILRDLIVYIDDATTKVFNNDAHGKILKEIRGSYGRPSDSVISLSTSGLSLVEEAEKGSFLLEPEKKLWEEFASWLRKRKAAQQ